MSKYFFILIALLFLSTAIKSSAQTNEQEIIIYWDASLSQNAKNVTKEIHFLDAYFAKYPNCKVDLVIFNTKIISNNSFNIVSSNWNLLREKLEKVTYHGGSDFALINTDISKEMLLLFTDGQENFNTFEASLYSPRIITISSSTDIDKKFLYQTAFYNRGYYVNLLDTDVEVAIKAIDTRVRMPKLEFVQTKNDDGTKKYVHGIVIDEFGNPLPNVTVSVHKKNKNTLTDQKGAYTIAADQGDLLTFSSLNMEKVLIEVTKEEVINIEMVTLVNELGPAIVTSKKNVDDEIVQVGKLNVNKRSLGYAVQSINEDQIQGDSKLSLGESISGKFAGVMVGGSGNAGQMIIRGINSIKLSSHPFFIVDGIALPQSGKWNKADYSFLNPGNIEEIKILKGLAATNQYGSVGRNGVVLITTKQSKNNIFSTPQSNNEENTEIEYKIFAGSLKALQKNTSSFKTILQKFSDPKESYAEYLNMLQYNKNNISFFIESSDYFFTLGENELGWEILSNLAELFPNDTSVLKVLAFNLEKHKLFDKAQYVYRRIISILPSMSQSYLDLANNLFDAKEYQKSINSFNKITNGDIEEVPSFNGLNGQIKNDFKDILRNRNQKWNLKKVDPSYFVTPKYKLRVVTEWTHPQTAFNMQFINSKKQYFVRTHNQIDNKEKLNKEIAEGFTSDEYVSADIESGTWYLNITTPNTYKPDVKYPKFLKIKVFTQFGSSNQKLKTHIVNLDKITNGSIITSFTIQ
ncbi:TonB-dependent receptor plug domain-containing protein [Aquimarina pacifica]|uniref:TonB-dependent receptor plug domain-containing protein n=1 Tax=Aquimarina pacifica TaxID=1296415 RepID=UPI00046FC0A1|nr:TonB-dependent receptor plug domain-containing protein [Aquimarina pacifica]